MPTLEEKMERLTRMELAERSFGLRVEDIVTYSRLLLEHLGKEKAVEAVKKARWDARYNRGKEAAERLGHPRDVDTFVEEYFVKAMDKIPFLPPAAVRERSTHRVIVGVSKCFFADAVSKLKLDKDLLDVVKAYCTHDEGWVAGWNPEMKFEKVKFLLDGDDACDFLCEVKGK